MSMELHQNLISNFQINLAALIIQAHNQCLLTRPDLSVLAKTQIVAHFLIYFLSFALFLLAVIWQAFLPNSVEEIAALGEKILMENVNGENHQSLFM